MYNLAVTYSNLMMLNEAQDLANQTESLVRKIDDTKFNHFYKRLQDLRMEINSRSERLRAKQETYR